MFGNHNFGSTRIAVKLCNIFYAKSLALRILVPFLGLSAVTLTSVKSFNNWIIVFNPMIVNWGVLYLWTDAIENWFGNKSLIINFYNDSMAGFRHSNYLVQFFDSAIWLGLNIWFFFLCASLASNFLIQLKTQKICDWLHQVELKKAPLRLIKFHKDFLVSNWHRCEDKHIKVAELIFFIDDESLENKARVLF